MKRDKRTLPVNRVIKSREGREDVFNCPWLIKIKNKNNSEPRYLKLVGKT